MKLEKICKYEGTIKLVTGLAIKGASNELNIGGADSEVVKNPLTGEPLYSWVKPEGENEISVGENLRDEECKRVW